MDKSCILYTKKTLPRTLIVKSSQYALIIESCLTHSDDVSCTARFQPSTSINWQEYTPLINIVGCLGIVQVDSDIFLSVLTEYQNASSIENCPVYRLTQVRFYSILKNTWDNEYAQNELSNSDGRLQMHPCEPLIKLLSNGSFYFSHLYNLSLSTQNRYMKQTPSNTLDSSQNIQSEALLKADNHFIWNASMIKPLYTILNQQIEKVERQSVFDSGILLNVICGFIGVSQFRYKGETYEMTIISRVSSKRAGARFLARGIDDEGNVSNFVETEFILK